MLNSKAKIGSLNAGLLTWNRKRRQIASLGQKLNIVSLNNNKIFSVTKNIQLVEGDSIIKNETIKFTYQENNQPIILQVEDQRINLKLYSSATVKVIGVGKNVPKISLKIEEGNIITTYKNEDYQLELVDSTPVSITIKYQNDNKDTTLLYSDINLTKSNLINKNLIDSQNIKSILIPYKSLTSDLWNYFLNEILKFVIENKLENIPIYLNNDKSSNLVTHMLNRYNFEIINKLFNDNSESISSSNYVVQIIGGYDKLTNTSTENILSWILSWVSEFTSESGKFKQYVDDKMESSNLDNLLHFIIAHRISSGFLQVSDTSESEYIKNLQQINSSQNVNNLIKQTFTKYNFFDETQTNY